MKNKYLTGEQNQPPVKNAILNKIQIFFISFFIAFISAVVVYFIFLLFFKFGAFGQISGWVGLAFAIQILFFDSMFLIFVWIISFFILLRKKLKKTKGKLILTAIGIVIFILMSLLLLSFI